jgi:P27 family predicted phage terminase small subunit
VQSLLKQCNAYALWIEAIEAVQKYGAMIKSPNGYPTQSPYLATVNRQAEIMMRIASEFGFTPASRSRIFSYSQNKSMLLENVDESDDGLTKV